MTSLFCMQKWLIPLRFQPFCDYNIHMRKLMFAAPPQLPAATAPPLGVTAPVKMRMLHTEWRRCNI